MRPPRSFHSFTLVALCTLAACGDAGRQVPSDTTAARAGARFDAPAEMPIRPDVALPAAAPMVAFRAVVRRTTPPISASADDAGEESAAVPAAVRTVDALMLIRTATASVEVKTLDPAVAAAREAAARYGGVVANAQLSTGRNEIHRAVLQIKVPAARFDALLTGISPLGRVESVAVNAEDVGEEYVDLEARLVNLRRLETRLIDLLANRTGKLTDVLSVERELARVRGEIEQIEGRRRYLQRSVAMSTLELSLHEPERVIAGAPGVNPIAAALRQAWRNFVALAAWCIASLGVVLPVVVVLGGVGLAVRRTMRPPPATPMPIRP